MLLSGVLNSCDISREFRLVLGGQGELCGLVFERGSSLFDFGIFPLHFFVLLEQQAGFFLEFFVGLLQFFLLSFQPFFGFLQRTCLLLKLSIRFRQFGLSGSHFVASDCDCLSSSSVRIVAVMVFSMMPMISVS